MSKRRRFALCILSLATLLGSAAASGQPLESSERGSRLFSVEVGALVGYNLEVEGSVAGRSFGLSLAVIDSVEVGFGALVFDGPDLVGALPKRYAGMTIDYLFTDRLAFTLLAAGVDGVPGASFGAGFGARYLILRSRPQDGFRSALKLKADLLLNDEDGLGGGTLAIGLAGSIGL